MLKLGESSLSTDRGCGSLIYLFSYRSKIERTIGEAQGRSLFGSASREHMLIAHFRNDVE